jgi:two-component sensor histidine kinase
MLIKQLTAENAHLTEMLKQAGLDAEEHALAERIHGVLTNEIHHRMKNMLTMVTSIVRQSMRTASSLADAEAAIDVRLMAMAKAHDLLMQTDLKSAELHEVIIGATQQHDTAQGRITLTGDDTKIRPSLILPLTLAINELCTNAIKYGAFSQDSGHVTINWSTKDGTFTLRWEEIGGPTIVQDGRRGLGMRLIEDALPRQLGGAARLDFLPSGLVFELVIPQEQLAVEAVVETI